MEIELPEGYTGLFGQLARSGESTWKTYRYGKVADCSCESASTAPSGQLSTKGQMLLELANKQQEVQKTEAIIKQLQLSLLEGRRQVHAPEVGVTEEQGVLQRSSLDDPRAHTMAPEP